MSKIIKENRKFKIKGLLGNDTIVIEDRIKDKYGFLPKSVWDITRSKELSKLVNPDYLKQLSSGADFSKRAGMQRDKHNNKNKPIPEFLPEMVKRCLQIYTKKGDRVLDPFSHSGIVALLAAYYGRIGYGVDIVPEYIKYSEDHKRNLSNLGHKWSEHMHYFEGDAQNLQKFNKMGFDYMITSPPYFNTRKYVDVAGQLSSLDTYEHFKIELHIILSKIFDCLKNKAFATFVISDIRLNDKYVPFARDISKLAESVGFIPHDTIINVLRSPFILGIERALIQKKRMIKYHEYILTFQKVE